MDVLSEILSLMKPRSAYTAGLDAGGNWALRYPDFAGVKFNAVTRGACWIRIEGEPEPTRLETGDCFLMTKGRPFVLASDPWLPPADAGTVHVPGNDGIAQCNGGGDFFLVGGRFSFGADYAETLFGGMPPIIVAREPADQAPVLRWALAQLATELLAPRPGGPLVAEHLAHIMLVQVLRIYLGSSSASGGAGWLQALADRKLAKALGAMHGEPGRRWTLSELAGLAGLSRTVFAERFRRVVGVPPMDYLTRWRMLLAAERLRRTGESVAAVAVAVGYESESAFSTAFKRIMATSPRGFQRQHRSGQGA